MLRDTVQNTDPAIWPQLAMLLFIAVFVIAAVRILLPRQRAALAAGAQLPLNDEDDGSLAPKEDLL